MLSHDDALVEKTFKWLAELDQPHIAQRLYEEARIEEVHHSVFRAAGVYVNGHPFMRHFRTERAFVIMRAGVAQEIPRRTHEGVHGIRLAPGSPAAFRAGGIDESLVILQR